MATRGETINETKGYHTDTHKQEDGNRKTPILTSSAILLCRL